MCAAGTGRNNKLGETAGSNDLEIRSKPHALRPYTKRSRTLESFSSGRRKLPRHARLLPYVLVP